MSDALPRRTLESLKKEAKRWLDALQASEPNARDRFERAVGSRADAPTLRDVQHALAREHGFAGWTDLRDAVERAQSNRREAGIRVLAGYEVAAQALLDAYRLGTPDAMEAHYRHTWHRRAWEGMRQYVQLDLGKRPVAPGEDVPITLDDARYLVAFEHGFPDWAALRAFTESSQPSARTAAKPMHVVTHWTDEEPRALSSSRNWDAILDGLRANSGVGLRGDEMTDALLAEVTDVETIAALNLNGSAALTDDGLLHLAKLPGLTDLDLGGTAVTDRGLAALRHLPALRRLSLIGTRVTDAGLENLAHCHALERLDLDWTRTGDGAVRALAGKPNFRHFSSGELLTDAGIGFLHDLPVFKTWRSGESKMALLSYEASPNYLRLRGRFTDRSLQALRGLDGLFALNIDDANIGITAAALESLPTLPKLSWLACDAKDDWMPIIAAMPHLRFLGAQDTVAGDDGFVALSKSQSIEYIWGRRCHNLHTRGFQALARMPALRALSVSCLNVEDDGVAALPSFPALRELMPMDVPDTGYRYIGKCSQLESLILMYCRETTDAATEHITGLSRLSYYFNSYTTITDRTPELLSAMDSLERIIFDGCHLLTNDGIGKLARLPKLRELRVSGRGTTPDVAAAFPPSVIVHQGG